MLAGTFRPAVNGPTAAVQLPQSVVFPQWSLQALMVGVQEEAAASKPPLQLSARQSWP